MSPHEWSEHTKKLVDLAAWGCAGVAAVSLAQAALVITMLAGSASFVLACLRIYDWFQGRKAGE